MDYSPISGRRVLLGFSFTGFVALLPLLFLFLTSHSLPLGFLRDADGGYQGVALVVGSVIVTTALVGLVAATVVAARRAVRRPSRA